jgi:DNA topoisomerase-1
VRELAEQGWANTRIAKEIGSSAATVKADVEYLEANEGFKRPPVVPAK